MQVGDGGQPELGVPAPLLNPHDPPTVPPGPAPLTVPPERAPLAVPIGPDPLTAPALPTGPTGPTGHARLTDPTRPTGLARPTASARSTQLATPVLQARPTKPTASARHARLATPVLEARPTRPTRHARPTKPTASARHARLATPVLQARPTKPTASARHTAPAPPAERAREFPGVQVELHVLAAGGAGEAYLHPLAEQCPAQRDQVRLALAHRQGGQRRHVGVRACRAVQQQRPADGRLAEARLPGGQQVGRRHGPLPRHPSPHAGLRNEGSSGSGTS
ncbi:hypothetical protein ACGF3G_17475 [Streptomyces sp. NPDC048179]|uniref:hypothetical protein n=1 Tax=Streptomyces sp. NPDC048179 TaxID=3365506 RepID=UPI003715CF58